MNEYRNMSGLEIAKEGFKELDKRDLVEYMVDMTPFVGWRFKFNRAVRKRKKVLSELVDVDGGKISEVNALLVENNQERIDRAKRGHLFMNTLYVASGLIGAGYALGSYFS